MAYLVKELYYTLQGEGYYAGRSAVFCRFAGCNLWSGREEDRATAVCTFCDTDFIGTNGPGGGRFVDAVALTQRILETWRGTGGEPLVVFTGGEPTLQLDAPLVTLLRHEGVEVAIETNGTRVVPAGVNHICVSPKANAPLVQTSGDELKLVFPQAAPEAQPERFVHLDFTHFYLQPLDDAQRAEHTQAAIRYCLENPQWKLSVQSHKYLGIP